MFNYTSSHVKDVLNRLIAFSTDKQRDDDGDDDDRNDINDDNAAIYKGWIMSNLSVQIQQLDKPKHC